MGIWGKILLAVLISSLALLHPPASGIDWGRTVINGSVELSPNIILGVDSDKSTYCPSETVNITATIENRGNLPDSGNLSLQTTDLYSRLLQNGTWIGLTIDPEEIEHFRLNFTVNETHPPGIYSARGNFTSVNGEKVSSSTYRIKQGFGTLAASPSSIEKTVFPGDLIVERIYFWLLYPCYGATVTLNATSGLPGDWIVFTRNPVYLPPTSTNITDVIIYIDLPWNTIPGDYNGQIYTYIGGEYQLIIPVKIHVEYQGIFDISTEVKSEYEDVCPGGSVVAKTSVLKVFPYDTMDINLTYRIVSGNTTYGERMEMVAISDRLERETSFSIPDTAPLGVYTFYSILNASGSNWTTNALSYDVFTVEECAATTVPPSGGGGGGGGRGIGVKSLLLNVSKTKLPVLLGNSTSFLAMVKNTGSSKIDNVSLSIEGVSSSWLTIYPKKANIGINETVEFLVLIDIPMKTDEGTYHFKVAATDSVRSNEKSILLIIGKDEQSLTKLLLNEMERWREMARRTLGLDCMETSGLSSLFSEGETLRELAFPETKNESYRKAQQFIIEAIESYESTVYKADAMMNLRLADTRPFMFFPLIDRINTNLAEMEGSMNEREYTEFCRASLGIQKNSAYSVAILIGLMLLLSGLSILLFFLYKRRKRKTTEEKIEEIKRRLKKTLE